jgi:membrane associated rhomboid family serine protease
MAALPLRGTAPATKPAVRANALVCLSCQHAFVLPDARAALERAELPRGEPPPEPPRDYRRELALIDAQIIAEKHTRNLDAAADRPEEWWKLIPMFLGIPVKVNAPGICARPVLTWSLSALIVLLSLAALPSIREVAFACGFIPAEAFRDGGATIFTSALLHGDLLHLLGNLYFLLVFGPEVEDALGRKLFPAFLFVATAGAAIAHFLANPHSTVPVVGASGFIYAIMAFFALEYPRVKLSFRIWYFLATFPAWLFLLLRVVLELVAGVATAGTGATGIAHWGHLGGAATGFACWTAWKRIMVADAHTPGAAGRG